MTRLHTPIFMRPLVLLLSMAGCGGAPPARIFVLGDPPSSSPGIVMESGRPIIRILPVSVHDYLDTRDILLRVGQNEVKASRTGRWAERLSLGLNHAITAALSARLPSADIVADQPIAPPAGQILVDVEVFEIKPDGQCLLTASWTLFRGDGHSIQYSGRGTFVEQAADANDAAIASAMTRSVDRLADQIAACEKEIQMDGI